MARMLARLLAVNPDNDESGSDDESSVGENSCHSPLCQSPLGDFVVSLPGLETTVDSKHALGPDLNVEDKKFKTVATRAVEYQIAVPEDYKPGQTVPVPGPHGTVEVQLPPAAEPGKTVTLRQSPPADLRITVPPNIKAGQTMYLENSGGKIAVEVPQGLKSGDTFDITPPAVMVRVPERAVTGDVVVFQVDGQWLRAKIPATTQFGHFAARLPKPGAKGSPKGGG